MGEKETAAAIAVGAEVAKLLIMLAFQQMMKAGMTQEQIAKLFLSEWSKFVLADPSKIPDV